MCIVIWLASIYTVYIGSHSCVTVCQLSDSCCEPSKGRERHVVKSTKHYNHKVQSSCHMWFLIFSRPMLHWWGRIPERNPIYPFHHMYYIITLLNNLPNSLWITNCIFFDMKIKPSVLQNKGWIQSEDPPATVTSDQQAGLMVKTSSTWPLETGSNGRRKRLDGYTLSSYQ